MRCLENDIEEVLDFIQKHLKYLDRELLKEYVKQHERYGTIDYAIDTSGNVVAFCRWNISTDGKCADVLDFAIDEDHRNNGVGKDFILRAMKKFPRLDKLRFQRGARGDERFKILSIKGILKQNIF